MMQVTVSLVLLLLLLCQRHELVAAQTATHTRAWPNFRMGYFHSCVFDSSDVKCFGGNHAGQLGLGAPSLVGTKFGPNMASVRLPGSMTGKPVIDVQVWTPGKLMIL